MKAKEFFQRARSAEQDIKRLERLLEHYSSVGASISSKWGGVGSGRYNTHSQVETGVIGAIMAERGIYDELSRYRQIVAETENVISRVPQDRFRQILTLHYLAGMSLAVVAKTLGYQHTENLYRAHGWALREAQKIIDGRETDGHK